MTRLPTIFAVLVVTIGSQFNTGSANAMKIQSVTSPGGIQAWLVEEHSLPLMTMQYGFMGGSSQDPTDKPGVGYMVSFYARD